MRPVVTVEPVALADSALFNWDLVTRSVTYPEFARRAGIEGKVRVAVTVAPSGNLIAARLVTVPDSVTAGGNFQLPRAALTGLTEALYRPYPESDVVFEADVGFHLDW